MADCSEISKENQIIVFKGQHTLKKNQKSNFKEEEKSKSHLKSLRWL